jgi:glycosyltransferase involved in cell wall biosynthesis
MPRCSILLPVRDAAATLPAALASIARQTFADFEVVAVDDGSADASRAILEGAAARDPRIRVVARPAEGLVAALQAAAAAARGDLLARMDADDVMHAERLRLQSERFDAADPPDVLAARVRCLGPAGEGMRLHVAWQNALLGHDALVGGLFVDAPLVHPSVMLRREAFDRAGGYRDPGWAEDFDLWHRLRESGARFEKLPRTLLAWRDSGSRLTRTHPAYEARRFHAAKLHYFLRHPLSRGPVTVWGAGPIGRTWIRDLLAAGAEVDAAIDIDPRKIGRRIAAGRVPVLDPDAGLARRRGAVLGAVGSRGARDLIRARLVSAGLAEGREFLFVA